MCEDTELDKFLKNFYDNLVLQQEELPSEFQQVLEDNWDKLIDTSNESKRSEEDN